jgi:hypothetical protein
MTGLIFCFEGGCLARLDVSVVQMDGYTPCPFAIVSVYRAVRFLWWEIRRHVATQVADFYGKTSFTLDKGWKYYVRAQWIGADGRKRDWTEPIILTFDWWPMRLRAPW